MVSAPDRLLEDTLRSIEQIGVASGPEAVMGQVAATVGRYGYSALVLTKLPGAGDRGGPQILLNGWPQGWSERYEAAGHFAHDPIARHCVASVTPFSWEEVPPPLVATRSAALIVSEASEFQLRRGLCIPLPSRSGSGGLSLAGDKVEDTPALRQAIRLLAYRAHQALDGGWFSAQKRPLTVRERDVLSWIARGKTVADVAAILLISEHTVGEHLKHIRRKLGTNNSAHSVVKALQRGMLRL